ncbi:MAG TPA: sigma-70 family RNA polymerase sigma factor [Terriglobales bacterium]|nr:sigma-70 family RNA polymerase sigma factor [Terriglobales bacterium]
MATKVVSRTDVDAMLRGAQAGDHQAFESLYHRHKRIVYGTCFRMLRSTSEAEDSMQEVFLQVYRKISTFRGDAAFSTWLHRLTVNEVLMKLRKRKFKPEPEPLETYSEAEEDIVAAKQLGSIDRIQAGTIDRVMLEQAIEGLSPGYRMVFILHDVEGYQHHEIADLLGFSEGNCKAQLHKARLRIRANLLKRHGGMAGASLPYFTTSARGNRDAICRAKRDKQGVVTDPLEIPDCKVNPTAISSAKMARILSIGPDADAVATCSRILAGFGHNVQGAATRFAALAAAKSQQFDIVLLCSGFPLGYVEQLTEELRAILRRRVPIIRGTGPTCVDDVDQVLEQTKVRKAA